MLDICLWHYLLSSDSDAMMSSLHTLFLKTFNQKNKLALYWIILKCNTSRFGSDIGEYLSSLFNPVVVMFSFLFYNWKMFFFLIIVNSFVRKKVYLLLFTKQIFLNICHSINIGLIEISRSIYRIWDFRILLIPQLSCFGWEFQHYSMDCEFQYHFLFRQGLS